MSCKNALSHNYNGDHKVLQNVTGVAAYKDTQYLSQYVHAFPTYLLMWKNQLVLPGRKASALTVVPQESSTINAGVNCYKDGRLDRQTEGYPSRLYHLTLLVYCISTVTMCLNVADAESRARSAEYKIIENVFNSGWQRQRDLKGSNKGLWHVPTADMWTKVWDDVVRGQTVWAPWYINRPSLRPIHFSAARSRQSPVPCSHSCLWSVKIQLNGCTSRYHS